MAYDKVVDSAKLDAGMTATANAIRAKTGGTGKIPWDSVTGFKTAVEAIQTDVESAVVNPLSVTANGTYTVPDGVDGYNPVTVNVPEKTIALQNKSVTPTKSEQSVTADNGYDGLGEVTVKAIPAQYISPTGTKTITENGTHDVKAYASVNVNVPNSGGGQTVNFTVTNNSKSYVYFVNPDKQIIYTTASGTYQSIDGVILFTYRNNYTHSALVNGQMEWLNDYVMIILADGGYITID